jgi:putative endonuclease
LDGYARSARGGAGEAAAQRFLEGVGMRLIERDVRLTHGQIDLVMLDGDCLVVVEVKARRGAGFGYPEEAVDARKLRRLRRLTEAYGLMHPEIGRRLRLDVVAVDLDRQGLAGRCRHLVDVLV